MISNLKIVIIGFTILLSSGLADVHEYYLSMTNIEYVEDQKSVQIITRIDLDDFEKLLQERYDENIKLDESNELETVNTYIERYLRDKLLIKIDGSSHYFDFIGKKYDQFNIVIFLEITDVEAINTIEIENTVLFELFEEQRNIIKTNIHGKVEAFVLLKENTKGVLNF